MNRRNFLAGLLATTAVVPLAKALPFSALREYGNAAVAAFDLAGGPDSTSVFFSNPSGYSWVERGFRQGFGFYAKRGVDFTRWGPDPGTVWYDEAADWLVSKPPTGIMAADVMRVARDILAANPIDDSQLTGYVDADGWHSRDDVAS